MARQRMYALRKVGIPAALACCSCALIGGASLEPGGVVLPRATQELACPRAELNIIERRDIADNLFDVEGCGRRARYSCIVVPTDYAYDVPCVREPDPARWDPDPATMSAASGRRVTVCGPGDLDSCIFRQADGWHWRRDVSGPGIMGGVTTTLPH